MSNISKIKVGETTYNLKDLNAMTYADNGVLGAKNLFDKNGKKNVAGGDASCEITSSGLRVYTESASTYKYVDNVINLPKNRDIRLKTNVTLTSGIGLIIVKYSDNGSSYSNLEIGTEITSSGEQVLSFNTGDHPYYSIAFFCTRATSVVGNVTYSDIIAYLASDSDDTYVPYAMTNRELTEELTVQESAVTDIIEGATVGDIGNYLYKQGNIVWLTLRLQGVTTTAWLNDKPIGVIPEGFRPRRNLRILNSGNANALQPIQINASGSILSATDISNQTVILSATWITD